MVQIRIAGALLACALAAPLGAWAQEPPPTLARAVDTAWARAVDAAEAAGHGRRADAALRAAQAPWAGAPSLEVGQRRDTSAQANGRETNVGVTVPLWLPGQRTAQLGAATAEQEAAQATREAARLRVAGQVREAQAAHLLQQAELAGAQAQLRTLADLARDVERRVAAGDLARTDALAASAEQLAAQALVLAARQRVAATLSQWRALTGLAQVPPPEPLPAPVSSSLSDSHPALKAAALAAKVAQKRVDVVQATRRDPPEVTVGARYETPAGAGPSSRGIGVSLRIPFATQDRNQPLLAGALSELELAQAREGRVRAELAAELEIAQDGLEAARQALADETNRSALLQERHALIERSWRAGNTALAELLRSLTTTAQAQADLQRKKAALDLAHTRVQQALGILP